MRCPFCHAADTRVVDSRLVADGEQVRRRRECAACRSRFTTYESAELRLPVIVKASDGRREPFDEAKLRAGMELALRKRPVPAGRLDEAVEHVRHRLRASGERELDSRLLGEWVMEELRAIDEVAYVRFASVYRQFQDVEAFREEVERLQGTLSPEARRQQLDLLSASGQRGDAGGGEDER